MKPAIPFLCNPSCNPQDYFLGKMEEFKGVIKENKSNFIDFLAIEGTNSIINRFSFLADNLLTNECQWKNNRPHFLRERWGVFYLLPDIKTAQNVKKFSSSKLG